MLFGAVVSASGNAYLEKLEAKSNHRVENEKNISAAQTQATQHAWIPGPDGYEERTEGHQPSTCQGTSEAERERRTLDAQPRQPPSLADQQADLEAPPRTRGICPSSRTGDGVFKWASSLLRETAARARPRARDRVWSDKSRPLRRGPQQNPAAHERVCPSLSRTYYRPGSARSSLCGDRPDVHRAGPSQGLERAPGRHGKQRCTRSCIGFCIL